MYKFHNSNLIYPLSKILFGLEILKILNKLHLESKKWRLARALPMKISFKTPQKQTYSTRRWVTLYATQNKVSNSIFTDSSPCE